MTPCEPVIAAGSHEASPCVDEESAHESRVEPPLADHPAKNYVDTPKA
jgi:hypothetical protein